jgi:transcriptional regulator with XRE-family HTH domain
MSELAEQLTSEFSDKAYAHAYMEEHVNMALAAQIKALREHRGLTQEQLAELAGMKQERVCALENIEYSAWTMKTLRKLARAFDTHLSVEFTPFTKGILDVVNLSKERLCTASRVDDLTALKQHKIFRAGSEWKAIGRDHLAVVTTLPLQAKPQISANRVWAQLKTG